MAGLRSGAAWQAQAFHASCDVACGRRSGSGTRPESCSRVTNRNQPRIACLTVPKAGTHLLDRVLCLHPRLYRARVPTLTEVNVANDGGLRARVADLKPGQILISHLPHRRYWERALVEGEVRHAVSSRRDPRDIAVSRRPAIAARTDHRHHDLFADVADPRRRIRIAIERRCRGGCGHFASAWRPTRHGSRRRECFPSASRISSARRAAAARQAQDGAIRAVFDHLGFALDDKALARLRDQAFSDASPTFRQGQDRRVARGLRRRDARSHSMKRPATSSICSDIRVSATRPSSFSGLRRAVARTTSGTCSRSHPDFGVPAPVWEDALLQEAHHLWRYIDMLDAFFRDLHPEFGVHDFLRRDLPPAIGRGLHRGCRIARRRASGC